MLSQLHKNWWKMLTIALMLYVVVGGLLIPVPARAVLHETIRNLYFHVPLWFGMVLMLLISLIYSIRYLNGGREEYDIVASELARVSIVFGVLGFLTGMLWGNYTWGNLTSFLFSDVKILGAFIGLLIYLAYFVLRSSIENMDTRARVAAVYSIFAYSLLIVFIFVIPRMTDSLHPGSGGNPAFNMYDLDNTMRLVFYPAVIAYTALGIWISTLLIRLQIIHRNIYLSD